MTEWDRATLLEICEKDYEGYIWRYGRSDSIKVVNRDVGVLQSIYNNLNILERK